MNQFTDEQLIAKHFELESVLKQREEARDKEDKPYKDGIAGIKAVLQQRLIERGANHTATDSGTAYLSDILNVKVTNREDFLRYAASPEGDDMLLASAQKDAVKTYMQMHEGQNPPGVETSVFTKLNIRRS
jgi:hypothetical protein